MSISATRKSLPLIKDETEYYLHQVEGIRKGARMSSFLLGDEPGLGKTLQALTIAAIDFALGLAKRVLVVSPASLKWNWAEECEKHTYFQYIVLEGTSEERQRLINLYDVMNLHILIVNYEQVRTHVKDFNRLKFDIILYDEAHYIKNHKSKRTKAALALEAKRHILITGTPLLNQVHELWTLLHRIDPIKWAHYWPFVNRYCAFGGFKGKQIIGVKNRAELNLHLQEVMIRRLKRDVLDLPVNQYIQVPVELLPEQRRVYDGAQSDLEIELPNDLMNPLELENALVKYLFLKQICGTLACIPGYDDISSKLDRVVEMLLEFTHEEPDSPSEPVVVFTQFRTVSKCLAQRLQKVGIQVYELNGDVPQKDRVPMVQRWSNYRDSTGRRAVIICMLQIAIGLNMTAASKCVFVDKLYVPKLNSQAKDRLDRIGADTKKPIQIYEIIARKTIEQRIETILKSKNKVFDSVVEESDWKRELYKAMRESV